MRFLYNVPALLYRHALIVGDMHFGIEQRLHNQGIRAEGISKELTEKLIRVAKENNVKKIIFLGDVKENILRVDPITKKIFEKLSKKFDIVIVRGNHDGGIEQLDVKIAPSEGLRFGQLGLVHGHSWPSKEVMQAKYIISAHQHPQLAMKDAFGKPHLEPVWVIASLQASKIKKYYKKFHPKLQLVVVPAFNSLVGFPIQKLSKEQLGPSLNNNLFKWDHALVYRLNGNCLGRVIDL